MMMENVEMDELAVILLMFANLWRARNLAIADRRRPRSYWVHPIFQRERRRGVGEFHTLHHKLRRHGIFFRNCFPGVCFYISVLVISRTGIPEHRISPNRLHKQLCVENHLKSGKGTEITGYYKKSEAVQNATARKRNRKNWTPK